MDGLIYTAKSHGGLGMPRIAYIVKLAYIHSGIKLKNTEDLVLKEAVSELDTRFMKYAASLQIP